MEAGRAAWVQSCKDRHEHQGWLTDKQQGGLSTLKSLWLPLVAVLLSGNPCSFSSLTMIYLTVQHRLPLPLDAEVRLLHLEVWSTASHELCWCCSMLAVACLSAFWPSISTSSTTTTSSSTSPSSSSSLLPLPLSPRLGGGGVPTVHMDVLLRQLGLETALGARGWEDSSESHIVSFDIQSHSREFSSLLYIFSSLDLNLFLRIPPCPRPQPLLHPLPSRELPPTA